MVTLYDEYIAPCLGQAQHLGEVARLVLRVTVPPTCRASPDLGLRMTAPDPPHDRVKIRLDAACKVTSD